MIIYQKSSALQEKFSETLPLTHCPDVSYSEFDELSGNFCVRRKKCEVLSASYARLAAAKKLLPAQATKIRASGFDARAKRVSSCGTFLSFRHELDLISGEVAEKGRLHSANFCKDRLCPMCAYRRSLKCYSVLSRAMSSVWESTKTLEESYTWLFLTLTVPNVCADQLRDTVCRMFNAFHLYINYAPVRKLVQGFYRTLEVTINPLTRQFHPHFHVLLAVPKSYFNHHRTHSERGYIKQEQWLLMWQQAMQDYSISQVQIQRVVAKSGNDTISISDALKEIAKYTLKDTDFLITEHPQYIDKHNRVVPAVTAAEAAAVCDDNVFALSSALAGVRLIGFGGCIKQAIAKLQVGDLENGDLIHIDDDTSAAVAYLVRRFHWISGGYECYSEYILTADQLKRRSDTDASSRLRCKASVLGADA